MIFSSKRRIKFLILIDIAYIQTAGIIIIANKNSTHFEAHL